MTAAIVRRAKLGRTSCREISRLSNQGIVVVRHWRDRFPEGISTAIRWGCTANIPVSSVLNSAEAIHQVNDKLGFRRTLNDAELCPATWFSVEDTEPVVRGGITVIVRPERHAQGRRLHVCSTVQELRTACSRYPRYYISNLINKVAEYRVFVAQGRAVWVAKKTPGNPEDVAWNVALGGRFDNVRWNDWPLKAVKTSIQAFNLSSLDFGGVDVMVDANGNCYVLEINSAPSLTSPYRQECTAKALDYMLVHGKERIALVDRRGNYKKFIHPSVCEEALMYE